MSNDRVRAGGLPSRKTHGTQLPAEVASEPPHISPHHRNLQPIRSATHRNPAHSSRARRSTYSARCPAVPSVTLRLLLLVDRQLCNRSVPPYLPCISITNTTSKNIRRPILVPTRLADPPKHRIAKPNPGLSTTLTPRLSIMKIDTTRPHIPVIPGQYSPPPPVYAPPKALLHLDPPTTCFSLTTPS